MPLVLVLLVAIASWQVPMAVECAGQCVRRPARAAKTAPTKSVIVQSAAPPVQEIHESVAPPTCRGPECQIPLQRPSPLPVQRWRIR